MLVVVLQLLIKEMLVMTKSLCYICKTNPKDFVIVDQVLVCCLECVENI